MLGEPRVSSSCVGVTYREGVVVNPLFLGCCLCLPREEEVQTVHDVPAAGCILSTARPDQVCWERGEG